MYYHQVIALLFMPFADQEQHFPRSTSRSQDVVRTEEHPYHILTSARQCMDALVRLYYARHGFETWDSSIPQFLLSVGFSAIAELSSNVEMDWEQRRAILSSVVLCVKGLYDQGKNVFVSEVICYLLWHAIAAEDQVVLEGFSDIEKTSERVTVLAQHVHSSWPMPIARKAEDLEEYHIDNLIRAARASREVSKGSTNAT